MERGRSVSSNEQIEGTPPTHFPDAEKLHKEVFREAGEEHLADEEYVGREGALEHDGHVGRVEELDGERSSLSLVAVALDRDLDPEALKVDNCGKDGDGREEVHDVRELVAVEGLLEGPRLAGPSHEEVEERDEGTLKLGALAGVDRRWGERLPDDGLADVGSNEERNARAETVALLEELVEEENDERGGDELEDEKQADSGSEV